MRGVHIISIHALREESDTVSDGQQFKLQFQSTLSVRRATCEAASNDAVLVFQSTLSVRRATHLIVWNLAMLTISIHALREESDMWAIVMIWPASSFQSTLSVRRATQHCFFELIVETFQSTLSVRRATP